MYKTNLPSWFSFSASAHSESRRLTSFLLFDDLTGISTLPLEGGVGGGVVSPVACTVVWIDLAVPLVILRSGSSCSSASSSYSAGNVGYY
jgi:hypothetical protein